MATLASLSDRDAGAAEENDLDRNLHIEVDRASWPNPGPPHYPPTFPIINGSEVVSIPEILLTIGILTTPTFTSGVSLSEYWAWVRYLHAISSEDDLTLTRGFWDLDSHQKTILSDDFGMGAPVAWLTSRLQLAEICDGRYFIDRLAATTNAIVPKRTAKRGPNKAPDFVFRDVHGVWHILECKGTQSGLPYRNKQVGQAGPPPTGAHAQKRGIKFPAGHTGQRLISALVLAPENSGDRSSLRFIDPAPEDPIQLSEGDLIFASDAATRATTAKALRLAGFGAASLAMSSPSGRAPHSRPEASRTRERRRREFVDERRDRAAEELKAASQRDTFQAHHEKFRGRTIMFDLPAPVQVGKRTVRRVRLVQGVNTEALRELALRPLIEDPIDGAQVDWNARLNGIKTEHDKHSAQLNIGAFFVSRIELKA
jgi:hypothetical protein